MALAFDAGVSLTEFWTMTAHQVVMAHTASQEQLYRLAWRTAYFQRVQAKHFPKSETALLHKTKPVRRQTIEEQYRMARKITEVMGKPFDRLKRH